MSYGVYGYGYFSDLNGRQYRLDVLRRNWDLVQYELTIEQDTVTMDFEADEPFDVVNPSSLQATFLLQNPDLFRPLFTADDELFRLRLREITGGKDEHLWTGNVLPDEYDEAYKEPPIRASLTAVDPFGILKQKYLDEYSGFMTVGELITVCLNKARKNSNDVEIFNGEFYERLLSRPDHVSFSEPLLDNIYHNLNNYTKKSIEEPDEEDFDCLKIIKTALRPYGAVIQRDVDGGILIFEPQARAKSGDWFQYLNGAPTGNTTAISQVYPIEFTTSGGYNRANEHFPVLRDQKLNIDKAIKEVGIDFEATKPRTRSFIRNGLFLKYDNSAQSLPGWEIKSKSTYGVTFEVRPYPVVKNVEVEPRTNQDLVTGGANNYGNIKSIVNRELKEPFGNMLSFVNPVFGFNYKPHDRNTQDDYIKSTPETVPQDVLEFRMKWQFPSVTVKNDELNITEWARIKIEIRLFNTTSGEDYFIQYNAAKEKYEFTPSPGPLTFFEFKTSGDDEQQQSIQFEVPEVGDCEIKIFGFEPHKGETDKADSVTYLSRELNIWDVGLRAAETDKDVINKTRKGNKDITYSTEKMDVEVIHWDSGVISSSTGDVTKDKDFNNTGGWTRKGLNNDPVPLLQNLANLYLDTYSRPLRLLSGTFNMPSITEFIRNSFDITEGNEIFTFYPVSAKLDFCTGFGELKLKQVGEPSTNFFDPNQPPEIDLPISRGGGPPVRGEGPGLDNFGGTGPTDEGFATPVLSSNLQRSQNNMVKMGPEPFDPPPGYSVEWLDDGSYEAPGVKWQKIISPEGQKIISKLGG